MAIDNQTPQILPNAIASQASSADINVIPNTTTEYGAVSVAKGFPTETRLPLTSGGVPPKQQDMNGLLKLISSHSIFLQNGGTWTFNQDVSDAIGGYAANTILWYFPPDEAPYQVRSMINDNTYNFVTNPEYIDGDHWEQVTSSGGGQGMPIGTIYVLSCSAGYVPEGSLPLDGTQYTKAQFTQLWNNYLTGNDPLLLTCSYADYASDIATYGQCVKWAVDTVNETFKVPTIKDGSFIQQALSDSELGKCYKAGAPNITGSVEGAMLGQGAFRSGTGAFTLSNGPLQYGIGQSGASIFNDTYKQANFDASRSSSVYGNSNTVQPEAVALRYFVVVADGSINQSMMDWAAWASSLAGKANVSLNNVDATGKATAVGWGMPDYSAGVSMGITNINRTYTAPTNGFCILGIDASSSKIKTFVNGNEVGICITSTSQQIIPVDVGDVLTLGAESIDAFDIAIFYPMKGVLNA